MEQLSASEFKLLSFTRFLRVMKLIITEIKQHAHKILLISNNFSHQDNKID